jgi:hypothetical protein
MKDLMKMLPKILEFLGKLKEFSGFLKYIPMLILGGAICFGVYYAVAMLGFDSYACVNNEIYKKISAESDVYVYKGGYCVTIEKKSPIDSIIKFIQS